MAAKRQRVLVVGGGSAGTAAAWSLARSRERFEVSLWESQAVLGGVATSEELALPDGSTVVVNDGVQGGAVSYRNSLKLHAALGCTPVDPVKMTCRFGLGASCWSNVGAPTELITRLQPEIARFGRVLKTCSSLPFIFAFVPIRTVLRWWGFPVEFGERLVYPLTALFFGTGNRTPMVSAAIVARVFNDPELRLFDYCPKRLLSQSPDMFAFSPLRSIYSTLCDSLRSAGVNVRLSTRAVRIVRSKGGVTVFDEAGATHSFDRVIFACDAATALKALEKPSWLERRVLGAVRYYSDVTVTHCDEQYMAKHYALGGSEAERCDYFIRTDPKKPELCEMAFDLGHYQALLRTRPEGSSPVYQTIFLDKEGSEKSWTKSQINPTKVLLVKWWRAFSHEVSHFRRVVPFVRFIQGSGGGTTLYAGSWCLVNTHEVAVISGLAAAYQLGADYPFADDALATSQFKSFLSLAHGRSMRRKNN
jgi:hypothetical protein